MRSLALVLISTCVFATDPDRVTGLREGNRTMTYRRAAAARHALAEYYRHRAKPVYYIALGEESGRFLGERLGRLWLVSRISAQGRSEPQEGRQPPGISRSREELERTIISSNGRR